VRRLDGMFYGSRPAVLHLPAGWWTSPVASGGAGRRRSAHPWSV